MRLDLMEPNGFAVRKCVSARESSREQNKDLEVIRTSNKHDDAELSLGLSVRERNITTSFTAVALRVCRRRRRTPS